MDGIDDLALGHAFAAADDLAVGGLFLDQSGAFLKAQCLGVQDTLAGGVKRRIVLQMQAVFHDVGHHGAHSRCAGQAGGLDGGAVDKTGCDLANKEVMPRLVGTQARKARDGLAHRQVFHRQAGLFAHFGQARRGGGGGFLVVHINGRGTHQQVAVYGRRYQHALTVLARQLEDRVVYMPGCRVIQQEVIAAPGNDLHRVGGVHGVVQLVGMHTGGVDDQPRFDAALVRLNAPAALDGGHAGHGRIKLELYAIFCGVLSKSIGQAERADDAAGRGPQGGDRIVRNVRLHLGQLVTFDNAQALYAVGHAVFVQLFKARAILLAQADDQAAALVVGKVQLFGKGGHAAAALHIQLSHQAAVDGIVARMYNGAVCLGGAAADILLLIQHQNIRFTAR